MLCIAGLASPRLCSEKIFRPLSNHIFAGVGVALATPFTPDSAIDFDALARLLDRVIEGGVDYLVALGTTAETPTLSAKERRILLDFIFQRTDGRVPVVVGVGGANTVDLIHTLRNDAGLAGAAGILSVVPYYSKPSQEGMYQHFAAIAGATGLPIILYNVPGRTAANLLPQTALRLAADFENVVAIKEASGSLPQCMELVAGAPDGFAVLSGDDNLALPQIACGVQGVISVAANAFPDPFCRMVKAALDGRFGEARALHYQLLPATELLFAEGNPVGVKSVLYALGVCGPDVRLPLVPATPELAGKIKDAVSALEGVSDQG